MGVFDTLKRWIKKLNPFSKKDGQEVVKELIKNPVSISKSIRDGEVTDGTLLYFEYDPKDKENRFDKKPLIIVLGISRSYILGINIHWINEGTRVEFANYLIGINTDAKGRIHVPLVFHYLDFKPLIKDPRFSKSVRLYIRRRMSLNGVIIDPKYLIDALRLKLEHFVTLSQK